MSKVYEFPRTDKASREVIREINNLATKISSEDLEQVAAVLMLESYVRQGLDECEVIICMHYLNNRLFNFFRCLEDGDENA